MNQPETIGKAFSKWRILAALVLGLGISGWLFYRSMSQVEFEQVETGTGTHSWFDSNKNGHIDFTTSAEFKVDANGNYRKRQAWEVIAAIDWNFQTFFWIFMALIAMVGRDLAYMWRIRILTHRELSWRRSFTVIMLWEFASALAPGILSGATVAMFILQREKIALGRSTAIVIITAFFDNLFYVILIPLVFLFVSSDQLLPATVDQSGTVMKLFWTGFAVFATLCGLLYLSLFQFPYLLKNILTVVTRLPIINRWKTNATQVGEDVALTAISMKKERIGFWLRTFFATFCSWTSRYLVINFILQAFISLGLLQHIQVLAKQLVLWMFLRISPTPGGSGTAEWAFSELLSDLTTSAVLLAGMAILWRLISYFPYLIIGSIILPRWLKRKS